MKNISSKHHYIPKFYLDNFTNDSNQFYIYLVKENRFKKNGQVFSPQSHFFEIDGNTLSDKERRTDFIEDSYSRLDDMVGKVFQKIKTSKEHDYGITSHEIALLQWFVSVLFWRVPANKKYLSEVIKNKNFKELGLTLTDKITNSPIEDFEYEEKLKDDPNFFKMLRKSLPSTTYPEVFNCDSPLTIFSFPQGLPGICGDNPLILRNPDKLELYNDDFILPLTKNKIFIRTKKLREQIHSTVKIEIDTLIFMQAEEYICCTDLNYPQMLKDFYWKHFKSLDNLRNSIFKKMVEE